MLGTRHVELHAWRDNSVHVGTIFKSGRNLQTFQTCLPKSKAKRIFHNTNRVGISGLLYCRDRHIIQFNAIIIHFLIGALINPNPRSF